MKRKETKSWWNCSWASSHVLHLFKSIFQLVEIFLSTLILCSLKHSENSVHISIFSTRVSPSITLLSIHIWKDFSPLLPLYGFLSFFIVTNNEGALEFVFVVTKTALLNTRHHYMGLNWLPSQFLLNTLSLDVLKSPMLLEESKWLH